MPDGVRYDSDFFLWTQEQAKRLRVAAPVSGNLDVDWENVAEELESLGKRDRREISNRLDRIYEHLLKLAFSPATLPRHGWISTVAEQRRKVRRVLRDSPSLESHVLYWMAQEAPDVLAKTVADLKGRGEISEATMLRLKDGDPLERRVLEPDYIPHAPDASTSE